MCVFIAAPYLSEKLKICQIAQRTSTTNKPMTNKKREERKEHFREQRFFLIEIVCTKYYYVFSSCLMYDNLHRNIIKRFIDNAINCVSLFFFLLLMSSTICSWIKQITQQRFSLTHTQISREYLKKEIVFLLSPQWNINR